MARLGDICTFYSGTGFPNIYQGKADGKYPFYKVGDISKNVLSGNRELKLCENYIDDDTVTKIKGTLLPAQTVVFAKIGEALKLNRRAITFCDCLVDNNVMGIKSDDSIIDSLYFFYFMCNVDLQNYCESTTVPSVRKTRIAELEIPLPPLEEQRKIAAVLDKVSDLIAKRRTQLDKLEDLVKSRFIEMFGDPERNPKCWQVVSITEIIGGKVSNGFFAKRDAYRDDGNVQVLGVANIVNRMYSNLENLPRTNATKTDVEKYGVKYGDMLFCRSSLVAEGIGKASIVPQGASTQILFECHVIRLPLDLRKCVPEFVQVLSTTNFFRQQIIAQSKTATMTTIGQDGILKAMITLPPIELQNQFAAFVEQIEKTKTTISHSLQKLEILKKALMQEYFG